MKQELSVLKSVRQVKAAIAAAREFAESKGVSITLERLAVCLGVSSRRILAFVARDEEELDEPLQKSRALLQMACEEIAASHIEHGMIKGNNTTMDVLMLKTHFGYGDSSEPEGASAPPVLFVGEDVLPE